MMKLSTECCSAFRAGIPRLIWLSFVGLLLSCDVTFAQDPPAVISGHERLTWNQLADSAADLATYEFRARIDGQRVGIVEDVRCASEPHILGFECSAKLPTLEAGLHTIELAAKLEAHPLGPWSAPLSLSRRTQVSSAAVSQRGVLTLEGARLESIPLTGQLDISSLAPLPDGRLLVGNRGGRILMIDGVLVAEYADLRVLARGEEPELLAITAHPEFAVNRSIFVAYVVPSGVRVAKLTELKGTQVSHEVVREGLPIDRRNAAAAIGIGPDRRIYVATGGENGSSDPHAGKVLRMNVDGSTPSDGWPAPVFAEGLARPVALSWSSDGRTLWVIGVSSDGGAAAIALRDVQHSNAGGTVRRYMLPNGAAASGVRRAGASDEMVVSADGARSLLRLSSDADATIVSSEWLLRDLSEGIVAIGAGLGDDVWVATRDRLLRVTLPQ